MFHFGQSFYRKLQDLKLAADYASDVQFGEACRMLVALAYVPETDVIKGWTAMQNLPGWALKACSDLAEYFERSYIGTPGRNKTRKHPVFPIRLWNCSGRALAGDPRTTNSLEAWHRAFQQTIACAHPTVYKLFGFLRREQGHQELMIAQISAGQSPPKKRKKYELRTERLMEVVKRYDGVDIVGFLRDISASLEINL